MGNIDMTKKKGGVTTRRKKCPVCGSSVRKNTCKKCGFQFKRPSIDPELANINIAEFKQMNQAKTKTKKVAPSKQKKDPFLFVAVFLVMSIVIGLFLYRFMDNRQENDVIITSKSSYEEENKRADQEKASIKEEFKQQVETTSKQNKDKEETESDSERNDIEEVSVKGVVYQYNQESAKVVKCNSSEKIITVLDQIEGVSVTEVGEETFRDCNHLEEVHIPEGITIIRKNAFSNCKGLKKVFFPKSLEKIEDHSFDNCSPFTIVGNNDTYAFEFAEKYNVNWEEVREAG